MSWAAFRTHPFTNWRHFTSLFLWPNLSRVDSMQTTDLSCDTKSHSSMKLCIRVWYWKHWATSLIDLANLGFLNHSFNKQVFCDYHLVIVDNFEDNLCLNQVLSWLFLSCNFATFLLEPSGITTFLFRCCLWSLQVYLCIVLNIQDYQYGFHLYQS